MLATGMARGAAARGKRIAFGDGRRILWSHHCQEIFRNNPNIAPPGSERASNLEWIPHYPGRRLYLDSTVKNKWLYLKSFKITPGEFFFTEAELQAAQKVDQGFVLIEYRVKPVYPNKQWPVERYAAVAQKLVAAGIPVAQFVYGGNNKLLCSGVRQIPTGTFRQAAALLTRASLCIGPEGALVHAAAAVGVRSVVLFGGFTDPSMIGYPDNFNLTGGAEPCGTSARCPHCQDALDRISVDEVLRCVSASRSWWGQDDVLCGKASASG